MNRSRFAVSVVTVATSLLFALTAAEAAGPYLKLKADKETVAPDQRVRLTLTAVSTRTLRLPPGAVRGRRRGLPRAAPSWLARARPHRLPT